MSVAVELRHISKRFPGVIANKDVSLKVETGTVHALVGENGAGKSTVMKILYGMQRPDSGEILVNGEVVNFKTPNDAIDAGIGMVHQHFMLADNFTVLENIILGSEPKHGVTIDFVAARTTVLEMATVVAERARAVLGMTATIERPNPSSDEPINALDFRINKLAETGFVPKNLVNEEIDRLLIVCAENQ